MQYLDNIFTHETKLPYLHLYSVAQISATELASKSGNVIGCEVLERGSHFCIPEEPFPTK